MGKKAEKRFLVVAAGLDITNGSELP